ncbi:MAG TPA: hypothetical protein VF546_10245 [Pyrinomonadaceae bacterium]|jgi:hypothetical protein
MPTKTTKKDKGETNKKKQQAALASAVYLGPPFYGWGPYPGGAWRRYPVADGLLVPCPGYWGYVKLYPTTGGMVAQLGAEAGTGAGSCLLYTYYQYVFSTPVAGEHIIALTLNLGPVSRRPRYGRVQILGVLQIMGPGGQWADFCEDLPSNTGITLVVRPRIQAGGLYTLRFGVAPLVENAGQQSYGEAIVNSALLTEFLPYGVQAAQTVGAKAAGASDDIISALLNSDEQQTTAIISLDDAVQAGVG